MLTVMQNSYFMSDSTKTIVFDGAGSSSNTFDPNYLLGMMMGNGGFGGGFGNGSWILVLFLFVLFGGNWGGFGGFGNGFGGNGAGFLSNQINEDTGRQLVMQAIQGNRDAIAQLSSSLNCSLGDIQNALFAVQGKISDVANQVGMSSLQVINAIDRGDAALASQLASCCCDLKGAIKDVAIGQERGFSSLAYATQQQTCDIEKAIASSTNQILEGQRAAEMRDLQDKIDALREKNAQQAVILNNAQQTAQFAAMLAPIQADLADIKCNQVPVKKIACPDTYVPVNNSINATYGLIPTYCGCGYGAGYGFPYGWNNGGSLWG